jgi:Uma2 family endonuclease
MTGLWGKPPAAGDSDMASTTHVGVTLTLEEFLRLPEIDEHPYQEFIDGRMEAKVSPQKRHSAIQKRLVEHLDAFAAPENAGESFPELRCTFAGRSIIPDIAFLLDEHIEYDELGELVNETTRLPDIHIEIVSRDQSVRKCRERIVFSTANGCPLGWLIDPENRVVQVFRPGEPLIQIAADGVLEGEPVLPGYRLPVSELFGWLKRRNPIPPAGSSRPDHPLPESPPDEPGR